MESFGWVFRVKAYSGESLGHFLGRFRRANRLSHKAIADPERDSGRVGDGVGFPIAAAQSEAITTDRLGEISRFETEAVGENAAKRATASANTVVCSMLYRDPCASSGMAEGENEPMRSASTTVTVCMSGM